MKAEHTAASINVTSVITGNLREGLLVRQLAYSAISRGRGESVKPRGLARGEGGVLAMGVIAASEFIGGTCIAANLAGNMARWRKRWSDAVGVWGGWWGVSLAGGGGGVTGGEFR
ncbi:hypothetical protein HZH66_005031 [Vespula vulgaris]|uniref:Uncharacterized protein n=1 Tax=Vespula vulgaris TaxID=7454 RepID=A0A834KDC3_VESVU|nr:hypothetical protein HZH66_005031 [Vespula vulgaris]